MKHRPPAHRARHGRGRHRAPPVRRHGRRGPIVLTLVGTFAGLSTGVAAAYWMAGGTGSGTVSAGTAAALVTVPATASTTSLLYPNGAAADVTMTVRNPNTYAISVTGVAANGAVTAAGGIGSCTTTGVAIATPTAGLPFTVPAKVGGTNGSATVVLTAAATMANTSDNGCQGATFTIPLTLSGTSI